MPEEYPINKKEIESLRNQKWSYGNPILNILSKPLDEINNDTKSLTLCRTHLRNIKIKENKLKKIISSYYHKKDLAKQICKIQPLFFDSSKIWWIWDNEKFKWERVDDTDILVMVDKITDLNTIKTTERSEILEALKQEGRRKTPKPIKPTWIQFKDKIFDIKTGKSFLAIPKYFVTNPIPWKTHTNNFENTPNMDKILEEWVGKEHVQTLYEILAYCLLPDYPIHRLFCLIGNGMNGKSCFLRLLNKFIGNENIASSELDTLLSSRFETSRLYRKSVCIMGETNFNEINQTSIIKKLTGQDTIGFEFKNKDPFEDYNYAKIIIATNNLPTTTDKTIGFYRRWTIIDFPNTFSEEKDILKEIPEEEYESLALKCIGILNDLLKKRKFHNEGELMDRIKKYEEKSDFLQKFLDEFTEEDPDSYITKTDFRKKFQDWCNANRHRKMAENTIGKKLKEKGIEIGRKYFDWMYDGKGGQLYCYLGIKWSD